VLFAPREQFTFDNVLIVSELVLDGELITPGEHFFFDIEFHRVVRLLGSNTDFLLCIFAPFCFLPEPGQSA